jgi:hypothetical protein
MKKGGGASEGRCGRIMVLFGLSSKLIVALWGLPLLLWGHCLSISNIFYSQYTKRANCLFVTRWLSLGSRCYAHAYGLYRVREVHAEAGLYSVDRMHCIVRVMKLS